MHTNWSGIAIQIIITSLRRETARECGVCALDFFISYELVAHLQKVANWQIIVLSYVNYKHTQYVSDVLQKRSI